MIVHAFGVNELSPGLSVPIASTAINSRQTNSDSDASGILGPLVWWPCILGLQLPYPTLAQPTHTSVCVWNLIWKRPTYHVLLSLVWQKSCIAKGSSMGAECRAHGITTKKRYRSSPLASATQL